jgi:hypothetical protein
MILTKEFIHEHKTENKGWTEAQLKAIGVEWQPPKGWIKAVTGKEITEEQKQQFILGKHIYK